MSANPFPPRQHANPTDRLDSSLISPTPETPVSSAPGTGTASGSGVPGNSEADADTERRQQQRRVLANVLNELADRESGRKSLKLPGVSDKALKVFDEAARWFARTYDPFINIIPMFRVSNICDIDNTEDPTVLLDDADLLVTSMAVEERLRYIRAYKALMSSSRGLQAFFESVQDDLTATRNIIVMMDTIARRARSDDTTHLKQDGVHYLLLDLNQSQQLSAFEINLVLTTKAGRGFNHLVFAQLLCPHKFSAEYAADPESTRLKLLDGTLPVNAISLPAFCYDGPFDPDQKYKGLLRGPLPVRVYKHLFTGPSSARDVVTSKRKRCQANIHGMTRTSPRTIAYAVLQTRHMLSHQSDWSVRDGPFNNKKFFSNIVNLFEAEPDSPWVAETLDWWDKQVFGVAGRVAGSNDADSDDDGDGANDFADVVQQRRRTV